MEMHGMNHSCDLYSNYSCWKDAISNYNSRWSVMMISVEIMMCLFMIVGAIGNSLVLVIYSQRRQKTSANVFIMFLACIDLFACIVLHPYIIYKLFNYYDQTWTTTCKFFEYLNHCTLSVSGLTLLLVAIDRYLAICQPVKFLNFDKHVVQGIASVTVISVVASMPIIEFYGASPFRITEFNIDMRGFRCHYQQKYQNSKILASYGTIVMCLFLTEILIMIILYRKVALTAYRSRRVVMPLSNAHILAGIKPSVSSDNHNSLRRTRYSGLNDTESQSGPGNNIFILENISRGRERGGPGSSSHTFELSVVTGCHQDNISRGKDTDQSDKSRYISENSKFSSRLKAAKILFCVTAIFFLSWMPFFIMRICETVEPNYWNSQSPWRYIIQNLLNHVFYLNNAANPIIYTIINKNFRLDSKKVFGRHFRFCTG